MATEHLSSFDGICAKHDVTKIKTIGDSYMAVAFGYSGRRRARAPPRPVNKPDSTRHAERSRGTANSE
ncbi:MAG: hypothetical protein IPM83_16705 [Ignavibacteria bacterium]|nr:hypothetical protein [Ignavibacteria bacterium]